MRIRPIASHEWETLRDIRLRALADPDSEIAFGEPLAKAIARPDEDWRDMAARGSVGEDSRILVADVGGEIVGMAAAFLEDDGRSAHVWGMWVDPRHRRTGLASAFLAALAEWASGVGAGQLRLHVTEPNAPAARVYAAAAFVPTGAREKHRPEVDYWALELVRRL